MRLTITEQAALQIRRAAEGEGGDATLRIAARRTEDGGVDYGMGFDRSRPRELAIAFQGVVAPTSRELLDGATLDYVELEPGDFRFIFSAARTESAPEPAP